MNIAVIFAGGTGTRMNTKSRPKQFLEMHGKPVLIYTLEHFQNHPQIDHIILVSLAAWLDYAAELVKKFSITKVSAIVPGGSTGQESIYHGIKKAHELYGDKNIVLIHDGVRPLIDKETITIFLKSKKQGEVGEIFDRSSCFMAKAPQCFTLGDIYEAHQKAIQEDLLNFIDSASLMQHYGLKLYTVEGHAENIKITTPVDFYIFRAIIDAEENLQIIGL